jgi:hypothetical protein
MIGYKVFDKNLKCRDFQYEVNQVFKLEGELKICKNGFHFCEKLEDCFNYYKFDSENRVCKVIALGNMILDDDKMCTNEIFIEEEISWHQVLELVNSGKGNTGLKNSGDYNSGNCNSGYHNSGDYNSGNRNSGYYNSGHCNSGHYNSGDYNSGNDNSGNDNSGNYNSGNYNSGHYNSGNRNSGNRNSGNRNSGHHNSGDYNSGDYNSGNYNSGNCNTNSATVRLFNKDSGWEFKCKEHLKFRRIISKYQRPLCEWVSDVNMTQKEKDGNPKYETTGGYLKVNPNTFKDLEVSEEDIKFLKSVPNFDAEILLETTGIDIRGK